MIVASFDAGLEKTKRMAVVNELLLRCHRRSPMQRVVADESSSSRRGCWAGRPWQLHDATLAKNLSHVLPDHAREAAVLAVDWSAGPG